ncbi:MAG: hypothetical protein FJ386_12025 [Verrucomicrobia bacterium]|nr:hypothetical protein [Verrucomicrobiota bacterium]
MKPTRLFAGLAVLVAASCALLGWQKARRLEHTNAELAAQLKEARDEHAAEEKSKSRHRHSDDAELKRLRVEAQEIHRMRNELTQLRGGAPEVEKLRAENQKLRTENIGLRSAVSAAVPIPAATTAPQNRFGRDQWTHSGFATPETALVSAIAAMKDGKPQAYLDALGPEEQLRMAKAWQGRAEGDIAAKHQADVAAFTGIRVLDRQDVSPTEVVMNVFLEGAGRVEQVSMKRVGADWKFGGFMRPPPPAGAKGP